MSEPLLHQLPKILDPIPGGGKLVDGVDFIVNWARANSVWPLVFGTSCCAIEMMAAGASHADWSRFGVEVVRATPRQADLIVLAGTIVEKMAHRLKTLYEQMPAPKYVVAMGACTISGGPFYYDSYTTVKGADRIIPVDVYIPGCPPRPEALLYGIMQLQEMIKKDSIRNPRQPGKINTAPFEDIYSLSDAAWEAAEAAAEPQRVLEREKFKAENPDYKPWRHVPINKDKGEAAIRNPHPRKGMAPEELLAVVQESFPGAAVTGIEAADAEKIKAKGLDYILDVTVPADQYLALINNLKRGKAQMDYHIFTSAVDWKTHFDVVTLLQSVEKGHQIFVRSALADRDNAEIDSLCAVYPSANYHEREAYDFFGIKFKGHPDLRRIFTQEDLIGFPLRKDWEDATRVVKRPY